MLIDTHAHLYWDDFKPDFAEVVKHAVEAGIDCVINIGVDANTSQIAAAATNEKLTFYSSIGIHPHEAVKFASNPDEQIDLEMRKLETVYLKYPNKVRLIGECGLDFKFASNPDYKPTGFVSVEQNKLLQIKLLQAHIALAKKLNLPLTIHCRDAWDGIFPYLQDTRGILHCYSGQPHHTQSALQSNYLVSFAGNVTYPKNDYLREAVQTLPLEKIVIETDCPFLSPQSKRGKRNEPGNLKETAECIAQLKGITIEKLGEQTTRNIKSLLKLAP